MKIVINKDYGGFGLSKEALALYNQLSCSSLKCPDYIERNDPFLIKVVEKLGGKADTYSSELKIVDIPDNVEWYIEEYDGKEWVAETHRTWE